ncbi:MAG: hypothetical protein ACRET3_16135 [Burkholderiales bacterium]
MIVAVVYSSAGVILLAVATAPWWARRDGDLGFAFAVAAVITVWLRFALVLPVVALGTALWSLARSRRAGSWRRVDVGVALAAALAALGLGAWTYFLFAH